MKNMSILDRGIERVYPSKHALKKRLSQKKPIRIYIGVDPTGNKLHIGHSIGLSKLQEFANQGHNAILLFGTGTVLVGDPSQRLTMRKQITEEEIKENIKTWKKQVASIIDFEKVEIRYNADWLLKLTLKDIINISSHISAVQLFKRDNFQTRIKRGDTVWFHETLYPLLQGYDSVALDTDAEIGGTDQMFNMLIGRELLFKMKKKEKFVITTPMIMGTDGKPMSKSSGNCVWLTDTPEDMYGKIMSISDEQMKSYATLLTSLPLKNFTRYEPIDIKKQIAYRIVQRFYDQEKATRAQNYFEKTIQKHQTPHNAPTVQIPKTPMKLYEFISKVGCISKSNAKRLIEQKAVDIDNHTVSNPFSSFTLDHTVVVKIGKRKYYNVKIKHK